MQRQSAIHLSLIYGLMGVCIVSVCFGYRQTAQLRPQRMKQWAALRVEPEPEAKPAFFKLLEEYRQSGRLAAGLEVKRQPLRQSLLVSAPSKDLRLEATIRH